MNPSFTTRPCEGCRKYPWCNTLQFGNPPKNRYCYENYTLDDIVASAEKVSEALSKFKSVPEKATDIEALKRDFQVWLKRLRELTEQELKKTPLAKLGD